MSKTLLSLALILQFAVTVFGQTFDLEYQASPIDNPMRGLVPYASGMPWLDPNADEDEKEEYFSEYRKEIFPHSLEFHYFSMRDLMPAERKMDFAPIEKWLKQSNSRGCQLTFRIYLEYPTHKKPDVPQFLIDKGLKIKKWRNEDKELIFAPDYSNKDLRDAIDFMIAELGKKYDGDPRVGCLTMGILGHWGEWHSYPKTEELFPNKEYQIHLMEQFEKAFKTTPILMRYPAGEDHWSYAQNSNRPFGFHDDSFAWATIETGKPDDDWFFLASMKEAGTLEAWKTKIIAGEIRPEVWGCVFDDKSCEVKGQEFDRCVQATHVSWVMDSGMFGEKGKPTVERIRNATSKVGKMGYEFHIPTATVNSANGNTELSANVENRGVAPFYLDWKVEVAILDASGTVRTLKSESWSLPSILPGDNVTRKVTLPAEIRTGETVGIRIPHPMKGGKSIRFANQTQQLANGEWLILK